MPDPLVRDLITSTYEQRVAALSNQLAAGEIDLGSWQITMRQELRDCYALQLRAGAGEAGLTADDYLRLGPQLRSQYLYLEDFGRGIADGSVSGDAIAGRSMLYARSSGQMYWRQATPNMPTYPGEQQCLGNCGCSWVDNGNGSWTWVRGKTDSCNDCIHNEQIYQAYVPEGQ